MPGIFEAEAVGHLRDGFSGRQSVFGKFFGIIDRFLLSSQTNKSNNSMSPKFRQEDGFKIYSNEEERKHIHVVKAGCEAKFWLEPQIELAFWLEPQIELATNYGFDSKDLKKIKELVERYGNDFKQQFAAHIGKRVDD